MSLNVQDTKHKSMSAMSVGQFNVGSNPSLCTGMFESPQLRLIFVMMLHTQNPSFLTAINSAFQSRMKNSEITGLLSSNVELEADFTEIFVSMEKISLPLHWQFHNPGTGFS